MPLCFHAHGWKSLGAIPIEQNTRSNPIADVGDSPRNEVFNPTAMAEADQTDVPILIATDGHNGMSRRVFNCEETEEKG